MASVLPGSTSLPPVSNTDLILEKEQVVLVKAVDAAVTISTQPTGYKSATVQTQVNVGTGATRLPTSDSANRLALVITNNGAQTIYLGGSTVTTLNGTPLPVGASISIDLATGGSIYGIVGSGVGDARCLEFIK